MMATWLPQSEPMIVAYEPDVVGPCPQCVAWDWRYVARQYTLTNTPGTAVNVLGVEPRVYCNRCRYETTMDGLPMPVLIGGD